MTVRELIEQLENLPPGHEDTEVVAGVRDGEKVRALALYERDGRGEPLVVLS